MLRLLGVVVASSLVALACTAGSETDHDAPSGIGSLDESDTTVAKSDDSTAHLLEDSRNAASCSEAESQTSSETFLLPDLAELLLIDSTEVLRSVDSFHGGYRIEWAWDEEPGTPSFRQVIVEAAEGSLLDSLDERQPAPPWAKDLGFPIEESISSGQNDALLIVGFEYSEKVADLLPASVDPAEVEPWYQLEWTKPGSARAFRVTTRGIDRDTLLGIVDRDFVTATLPVTAVASPAGVTDELAQLLFGMTVADAEELIVEQGYCIRDVVSVHDDPPQAKRRIAGIIFSGSNELILEVAEDVNSRCEILEDANIDVGFPIHLDPHGAVLLSPNLTSFKHHERDDAVTYLSNGGVIESSNRGFSYREIEWIIKTEPPSWVSVVNVFDDDSLFYIKSTPVEPESDDELPRLEFTAYRVSPDGGQMWNRRIQFDDQRAAGTSVSDGTQVLVGFGYEEGGPSNWMLIDADGSITWEGYAAPSAEGANDAISSAALAGGEVFVLRYSGELIEVSTGRVVRDDVNAIVGSDGTRIMVKTAESVLVLKPDGDNPSALDPSCRVASLSSVALVPSS